MVGTVNPKLVDIMSGAFKAMFPGLADRIEEEPIQLWLSSCLEGIVEFDGTLPKETPKQRNRRREASTIYKNNNFKELANSLRNTYPDRRALSPQELILTVYNGIVSVESVLDGTTITSQTPTTETESVAENTMDNTLDSNIQSAAEEVEQPVAEARVNEIITEPKADEANTEMAARALQEQTEIEPEAEAVHMVQEEPEVKPLKEEKLMAKDLNSIVETMEGNSNELATPAAKATNVSKVDKETQKAARAKAESFINDAPARKAYQDSTRVTSIITMQLPAAKRAKSNEGIIREKKKNDKTITPSEIVAEKLTAFARKVSGVKDMTADKFKTLDDAAKYAAVERYVAEAPIGKDGINHRQGEVEKAKQIYAKLLEMAENPTAKQKVVIPEQPSIPVKGFVVDGKYLNKVDFINLLFDKTLGVMFSDQFVKGDDENTTYWKLNTVKDTKSANQDASAGDTVAKTKLSIQPKNVKQYVQDPKHVTCIFSEISQTSTAWGSFKVDLGDGTPATVRCATDEVATSKNGKSRHKVTAFSLSVSVECDKVDTKKMAATIKGNMSEIAADAYWGTSTAQTKETIWDDSADLSTKPILKAVTNLVLNPGQFTDGGNATVAKIKAQIAKENADQAALDAAQMSI